MTRPGPGEVRASPPVRFPVYGLAPSWAGVRWLDSFGDAVGDEVRWVRLAHQHPESGDLVMVETHSRPLTDAGAARGGPAALHSVAFGAAFTLVNLTLPAASVPRPDGMLHALVDHAYDRSERYADWTPVTWQLDGAPVAARATLFAGGWAAFSDGLADVYLAAAGSGGSPKDLAFSRLPDASAYHFDLAGPLDTRVVKASSAAAWGDGEPAWRQGADWHPDQLGLLPGG